MRRLQLSSLAMDDGGRCLLDVISDPLLLQSFLESDSENISKDHHNGGSMTVASSTVLIGCDHVTASGQLSSSASLLSASSLKPATESMGFNCQSVDKQNLMGHITLSASNNTSLGVGVSVVSPVTSSYNLRAFTPTVVSTVNSRHSSPVVVTSVTQNSSPVVHFATKSNSQGSPLVQSMPPPSPLQQTRSPLPPHTPSPIPVWPHSPSNAQQIHTIVRTSTPNQVGIGHHATVSQVVHSTTSVVSTSTPGGNVIIPNSVAQKLQAQQLIYHSHQSPAIIPLTSLQQHQQSQIPQVVTTTSSVTSLSPVVQFIPTQQHHQSGGVVSQAPTNAGNARSGHGSNRSIQPKQPQQILPKPPNNNAVKQVAPVPPPPAPRTATVGVGIAPSAPNPPVMISQNAPSVFAGPQGTILLNHMLPNMGQGPLLIQGMQGMQGMQFTLRPQATFAGNPNANQGLAHNGAQNNAALIAALQASSHQQQTLMSGAKGGIPGQHTIVIPSSLATSSLGGQNINLAGPGVIHSPSQGLLARPNIILAPRMIGPHQGFQFHQIQTNQGPMTIALAHGQTLSLPSHLQAGLHGASINAAGQVTVQNPMAPGQGFFHLQHQGPHQALPAQSVFNQQAVQQNLLAGSVVTFQKPQEQQVVHIQQQQATVSRRSSTPSQNQPSTTTTTISHTYGVQPNQHHDSRDNVPTPEPAPLPPPPPKSRSKANRNKSRTPDPPKPVAKMLNLADLLKESGIMPENTPPTSPSNQTNHEENETEAKMSKEEHHVSSSTSLSSTLPTVSVVQPPMTMQPGQPSIFQMSQLPRMIHTNDPNHPQLKLSVAPDGSIILQPPNMVPAQNVPQLSSLPQRFVTGDSRPIVAPPTPQPVAPVKKEPPPPVVTCPPTSRKSKSHAALLARLNSPTVAIHNVKNIPDIPKAEIRMPTSYAVETYMKSIVTSTTASTVIPMNVANSKMTKQSSPLPSINVKAPRKSVSPQVTTFQLVTSNAMPTITTAVAPSVVTSSSTQTIGVNCINHVIVGMHNVRSACSTNSSSASMPTSVGNVCTVSSGNSSHVKINNLMVDKIVYSTSNSTCAMSTVTSTVTTTAPVSVAKAIEPPAIPRGSDCQRPPPPMSTIVGTVTQVQRGNYQTSNNSQQSSKQTSISKLNTSPPKICPHVQKPAPVTKSTCSNAVSVPKPPPQPINPLCDPLSRPTMFRHQLIADQDAAVKAHSKRFSSVDEACRTLLAYHVYHTPKTTDDDFKKADAIYENYAWELLEKGQELFTKYQNLILKESMRSFPSSEAILVEKLFVDDETISLALDKRLAAEGKEACVPLLSNPSLMAENEASSSKLQENFQESAAECSNSAKRSSDYNALKYELKTLQVRLHRPLKRDRVSSPTEDEPSNEPSMKRTIKPSKSPVSKHESRTMITSDNQATNLQDNNSFLIMGHKPLVKNEVKYGKMENHRDLAKSFEHHHHQNPIQRSGSCHSEDIIVKIREELNLSPIDHDEHDHHSVHDDFETATTTSGLADFELPVARTEFMSVDSPTVLSFVGEGRLQSDEVNYDFGAMDSSSEWTEAYAEQDKKLFLENEAAVESILNPEKEENHDLDLSDIEELDKHLVRTENSFKRGAKEANITTTLSNSKIGRVTIGDQSLIGNGDFIGVCSDDSVSSALGSDTPDLMFNTQVQSAIKSILGMQSGSSSENNSFSTTDGDRELISLLDRRSSGGGSTSRVDNEERRQSFSVNHSPIEYDNLNGGDDNEEDEDDDEDDVEEEDEEDIEEKNNDEEDNDDVEDHDGSVGEGANGSVGSNYSDCGSNPESDAALDEAVRSILL